METAKRTYTVGQVAELSGASVRALHHYEELGLLAPARAANGYRMYSPDDIARLQQIMLYRACGMELSHIKDVLDSPGYDAGSALRAHLAELTSQREQLDRLIRTVRKTIENLEEGAEMTDSERFEGLKRAAIDENERVFGKEARSRHGSDAVDAANEKLLSLNESEWNDMKQLETAIIEQLKTALATGDPASAEAAKLAAMHAKWIKMHWGEGAYSVEAHKGLAQGYLADERFRTYYDGQAGDGATEFLAAALSANLA